ncbi:hypothetical protein [Blastopirellula marina]|uniref:Uncharacterized protein n=1 Tax=Blastopirellula marina TaxID=124 RepID=A0A2S8F2Z6_9BACT|nr:hypothetical protein [Blastopirellula marina]PQO26521.1 hypothetical protein C5Y98_30750 [Blastopirellula marina]PQO46847.1 hypothetical protein C5Y93_06770 [Blastopirellula marina]PTL40834.1 hypothetical protein C5Y97_30765 [Blastopirellula marina]
MKKCFHDLTVSDVQADPIWRFTNENPDDDLEVESVKETHFSNLSGLIIASQVEFADSSKHLALLQNVSLAGQKVNDHFLSLTIEMNGDWFPLARYHDAAIENFGPEQLAAFVGKAVKDVFPIRYDLRETLHSDSMRLAGFVRDVPISPLTDDELISLALQ